MRIQSRIGLHLATTLAAAALALQPACGGKTAAGSANGSNPAGGDPAQTGNGGGGGGDPANGGGGGDPGSTGNVAPTVTITFPADNYYLYYPTGGQPPQPQTLRGSVTDDTAIVAQNILWTVTAPDSTTATSQGNIGGAGTTLTSRYTYTFNQRGNYTVELSYTDAGGLSASQTITVIVTTDMPPQVVINIPPNNGTTANPTNQVVAGDQLTLQGTVRETDGDTVATGTIQWTVTDPSSGVTTSTAGSGVACTTNNQSCQATYTYTFTTPGDYTISLTDDDGTNPPVTTKITLTVVRNIAPTCVITQPADGSAIPSGSNVQVAANVSDPNQPNNTLTVEWFLGAATGTAAATGANATLTMPTAASTCASQIITCRVTDNQGATGTASVNTSVNTAPTITIPTNPAAGSLQDSGGNDILAVNGGFFDTSATPLATPITLQLQADDAEDDQGSGANMTIDVYDSLTGLMVGTASINPANTTTATFSWTPPPDILVGRHTLLATVTDSCGTTTATQVEFIAAPGQAQTITQLGATNNWDVRALAVSGGLLYAGYRAGGNDYLASVDPTAATNAVTDLTGVLNQVSRRVRSVIVAGGQLYVGTNDGMVGCPVAGPTQQSCTSVQNYTNAIGNQVADPQTDSLLALPDGSLVAGTDRGVVFMPDPTNNLGQGVHCLDHPVLDLAYDPISDAIFGGLGGNGGAGNYAFRWDRPFDSCDSITLLDNTNTPMVAGGGGGVRGDGWVDAVAADSTGVWFGTANPSLLHLDTGAGTWTVYRSNTSPLVPYNGINDIAVQQESLGNPATLHDIIWTGIAAGANTDPSVLRRDEVLPTWTSFTAAQDGLPSRTVNQIVIAADGTKWLATANGIASYTWQ